jgi:hypothetical protein
MSMSDEAIRNGIYMRPLTKREAVAVMGSVVSEHLIEQQRFQEASQVADALLQAYPDFVWALLTQSSASIRALEDSMRERFPTMQDMPREVRTNFKTLVDTLMGPTRRAEALGWRETDGQQSQNLHRKPTLD